MSFGKFKKMAANVVSKIYHANGRKFPKLPSMEHKTSMRITIMLALNCFMESATYMREYCSL